MVKSDSERADSIKRVLRSFPKGLDVSEISRKVSMTRNVVAKYLGILTASGQVEMRQVGNAKIYTISRRIPLSTMLCFQKDLVVIFDHEGSIVQVNESYATLAGLPVSELLGRSAENSGLPLIDDPEITSLLGTTRHLHEFNRQVPGTEETPSRFFRIRLIPSVFEDGRKGTTLIAEDITTRVSYERQILEAESRYRAVVDYHPDMICRFHPDFSITFMNQAFRDYLGVESDSEPGKFLDFIHPDDCRYVQDLIAEVQPDQPSEEHEFRFAAVPFKIPDEHPEGIRWHIWCFRPICDLKSNVLEIQGTGRDITRQKELEEIEKERQRETELLTKAAMDFVTMSDDEDIYQFIASRLHEIIPQSIVVVSLFDRKTMKLTMKRIAGTDYEIDYLVQNLQPILYQSTMEPNLAEDIIEITLSLLLEFKSFYYLLAKAVPQEVCDKIEDDLNIGLSYGMNFHCERGTTGTIVVLLKKGVTLKNRNIITAFTHQASVALRRRQALRQARETMQRWKLVESSQKDGVLVLQPDGRILLMNPIAAEVLGNSPEQTPDEKTIGDCLHSQSAERIISVFREALCNGGTISDQAFSGKTRLGQDLRFRIPEQRVGTERDAKLILVLESGNREAA